MTATKILQIGIVVGALIAVLAACAPATSSAPTAPGLQAVTVVGTSTPLPSPTPGPRLITATPAQPTRCEDSEVVERLRAMPAYTPNPGSLAELDRAGLRVEGRPFVIHGVAYYPAEAPWQRFRPDNPAARLVTVGEDFRELHDAGVNTVRLFVWYDALFVCPENGAVPDLDAFLWMDGMFRLAESFDLRVILTLNHLPDLVDAPIYSDPGLTLARTAYLVNRYRDEPRLLMWDVRDAGDADYAPSVFGTPLPDVAPVATRDQVLNWLARTIAAVRTIDAEHPITAGWSLDAEATINLVDVVSLQHFGDALSLQGRIAALRALADKPLLLIATGASTFDQSEDAQARLIDDVLRVAEREQLAGWVIWTMYDFATGVTCWPDPCASFDDVRHHFGLWRGPDDPKPAAAVMATQAAGGD